MSDVKKTAYSGYHYDDQGRLILEDVPQGQRKVKTREFDGTEELAPGVLKAIPKPDVEIQEDEAEE